MQPASPINSHRNKPVQVSTLSPSKRLVMHKMPSCTVHSCDCLEFISEQLRTLATRMDDAQANMNKEFQAALELQKTQFLADWARKARMWQEL